MSSSHHAALLRAIDLLGSRAALARALGISKVAVGQWLSEGTAARGVPPRQCVRIEALTGGAVCRKSLRPLDWQDFWPESATFTPNHPQVGRNIDVAAINSEPQGVSHV